MLQEEKHCCFPITLSFLALVIHDGTIELVSSMFYITIMISLSKYPIGWGDETLNKATGLHGYLTGFMFCFLVLVFQKILEQSSILYSILQDKETDFQYGLARVERFKTYVSSLRTDAKYSFYFLTKLLRKWALQ